MKKIRIDNFNARFSLFSDEGFLDRFLRFINLMTMILNLMKKKKKKNRIFKRLRKRSIDRKLMH